MLVPHLVEMVQIPITWAIKTSIMVKQGVVNRAKKNLSDTSTPFKKYSEKANLTLLVRYWQTQLQLLMSEIPIEIPRVPLSNLRLKRIAEEYQFTRKKKTGRFSHKNASFRQNRWKSMQLKRRICRSQWPHKLIRNMDHLNRIIKTATNGLELCSSSRI